MSATPCEVQLKSFEVTNADSHTRASTSAPLFAPLHFTIGCTTAQPLDAHCLLVAVDFIADVASAQPAVTLVPLHSVSAAGASEAHPTVTLTPASSSPSAVPSSEVAQEASTEEPLRSPGVSYNMTVAVEDLSALRSIPLKHLLQVSVMRVRVVTAATATAGAATDAESAQATDASIREVATWNVVWHVRRDPQHDQELVRTVLSPLA